MKDWMIVLSLGVLCGLVYGGITWLFFGLVAGLLIFAAGMLFTWMVVRFCSKILS